MLVSEEYRKTLEDTHRETNHSWGQTAPLYNGGILTYMQENNFEEVLDYGSAHGSFRKSLNNPNIDVYIIQITTSLPFSKTSFVCF